MVGCTQRALLVLQVLVGTCPSCAVLLPVADEPCTGPGAGWEVDGTCSLNMLQRETHSQLADNSVVQRRAASGRLGSLPAGQLLPKFMKLFARVALNSSVPASDPFWEDSAQQIKDLIFLASDDAKEIVKVCKSGDVPSFVRKGCQPDAAGSAPIRGVPGDAWYCGRRHGMDWGRDGGPVADLCAAERGSAYRNDGICGRLSKKQLVQNYCSGQVGPLMWMQNPRTINVPSMDCLLDLVDCDIAYCQDCPGRCS